MAKSKEELIELVKHNIKAFNAYRKETNYEKLDLHGSDLSVANLCRADFTNCILTECDLSYSYLHSAILKDCDMSNMEFGRADMSEADLSGANLEGAILDNTILYGANLSNIKGKHINFEGAKIRETNLSGANLSESNLSGLDFNGVNLDKTILKGANLIGANLVSSINLQNSIFNEHTCWPEASSLPSDFDPTKTTPDTSETPDISDITPAEEYKINTDVTLDTSQIAQDFEFLDFKTSEPEHKEEPPPLIPQSDLPNFEEFSTSQFESMPQTPMDDLNFNLEEPGFALSNEEHTLQEPLGSLETNDDNMLHSAFNGSLNDSDVNELPKISSISQVEYAVKQETPAQEDSYKINNDINQELESFKVSQEPQNNVPEPSYTPGYYAPEPIVGQNPLQPVIELLNSISLKLDSLETEQKEQKETIQQLQYTLDKEHETVEHLKEEFNKEFLSINELKEFITEEHSHINDLENSINEKYSIINNLTEQVKTGHSSIDELKTTVNSECETLETIKNELTKEQENQKAIIEILQMTADNTPEPPDFTGLINEISEQNSQQFVQLSSKISEINRFDELKEETNQQFALIEAKINEINLFDELKEETDQQFARLEAKLDIIAQNDPLDQMDSLLGEFSDALQIEQENMSAKVTELTNITESVVSLLEANLNSISKLDINKVTTELHQMLVNLETNFRLDQERSEQKLLDIATIMDGYGTTIANMAVNEQFIDLKETIISLNERFTELLKDDKARFLESQVFESFYDLEFKIKQDFDKNQEGIDALNQQYNTALSKIDSIKETISTIEKSDKSQDIIQSLENIKENLSTELKELLKNNDQLKNTTQELYELIKVTINTELDAIREQNKVDITNLQESLTEELNTIKDSNKTDILKIQENLTLQLDSNKTELAEIINSKEIDNSNLLEKVDDLKTFIEYELEKVHQQIATEPKTANELVSLISKLMLSVENLVDRDIATEKNLYNMHNNIEDIKSDIDKLKREPKIDEEMRSIFEHILYQVENYAKVSKENSSKLTHKFEKQETEISLTLKDLDNRVSKLNSMIRNVYKAIDSMTDLITISQNSSPRATSPSQNRYRKDITIKPGNTNDLDSD